VSPEELERMNALVLQIQVEKDHAKFTDLVQELNDLLDDRKSRFPPIEPA
jgi:hypothetical protein